MERIDLPDNCKEFLGSNRAGIRPDACLKAIKEDQRYSNSSQYAALISRIDQKLRWATDPNVKRRLQLLKAEVVNVLKKPDQTFVCKIQQADGEEKTQNANENGTSTKVESDRSVVRDREERLRKDFEMFRDIIREENTLANARIVSFSSLQGFLLAAAALSINRASVESRELVGRFVIGLSVMGIAVAVITVLELFFGILAIRKHVRKWEHILYVHEQNGDVLFWGPDIVGVRAWIVPTPKSIFPLIFVGGWIFNIILAKKLLDKEFLNEPPRLSSTISFPENQSMPFLVELLQ